MRIVLLLLMSILFLVSNGQSDGHIAANGQPSQISLVFNQQDFGDRFSVLVFSEDDYDYYAIDLTKLGSDFERVYFMNLTYANPRRVVNLDPDLEKDQTWFKAYFKYKEDEIICLLKEMKEKTEETRKEMTNEEISAWMAKFNKFNKKSNDK